MTLGTSPDLLDQTMRQNPSLIQQMSNTSNKWLHCVVAVAPGPADDGAADCKFEIGAQIFGDLAEYGIQVGHIYLIYAIINGPVYFNACIG